MIDLPPPPAPPPRVAQWRSQPGASPRALGGCAIPGGPPGTGGCIRLRLYEDADGNVEIKQEGYIRPPGNPFDPAPDSEPAF